MSARDPRFRQKTQAKSGDPFDGILLVDKPAGPTSHDVVDRIRRHFSFKKTGHGGTLDPSATGLLVILIGKGTKLSANLIGSDKAYEGSMQLGITTDTHDISGEIVKESDWNGVTSEQLEAEMQKLTGDLMQIPPMVSAVKKDGVPLYKLARKGKTVERKPKLIHVYEFSLVDCDIPKASFYVRCTKGTYIRTLCADVGDALGCGACITELRRTRSGALSVENALSMEKILEMDRDRLREVLIPAQSALVSGR